MIRFIRLTVPGTTQGSLRDVFVNVEQIAAVEQTSQGARVTFAGAARDAVVLESAADVMARVDAYWLPAGQKPPRPPPTPIPGAGLTTRDT